MSRTDLSIVIPVYNAAPYLKQCLDSLFATPLAGTELICINDGSTDASPEILARYASGFPGMVKVLSQKNGGASVARNAGIAVARGQYIGFLDADDWVAPGFFDHLLELAGRHGTDMILGNGVYHFEGRQPDRLIYNVPLPYGPISGQEAARIRLRAKEFFHYPVLQIYRQSFLRESRMAFSPQRLHEDVPWTTKAFLRAGSLVASGEPGYVYRRQPRTDEIGPGSAMRDQAYCAHIASAVANFVELIDLVAENVEDGELGSLLRWHAVDGASSIFHMLEKIRDPELRRRAQSIAKNANLYSRLWAEAQTWAQRRRTAKAWLRNWL